MIANYHTHTWRCNHAKGREEEYVENAIQGGMKILGFSDHTPMPYDGLFVSPFKMRMYQLDGYVKCIERLRDQYKNDIEIHIGLETEYYPAYFDKLMGILKDYPIEYMILGQHFLGNEVDEPYSGDPNGSVADLERYVKQATEGMQTGQFAYLAHPDLFNYTGPEENYDKWMRVLCQNALKLSIPLEINLLGMWGGRHYPNPRFWKIAGEVGNTVIFGSDAHLPNKVWLPETVRCAEQIVKENNLTLIDTLEMRSKEDEKNICQ